MTSWQVTGRDSFLRAFGAVLAALQHIHGLKSEELAKLLGVSPNTVVNWRRGKVATDVWHLFMLQKVFGKDMLKMLEEHFDVHVTVPKLDA
jgi:transcriptional regulator with XRE-family HTH domain